MTQDEAREKAVEEIIARECSFNESPDWNTGVVQGASRGFDAGYEAGKAAGIAQGILDGYDAGFKAGMETNAQKQG